MVDVLKPVTLSNVNISSQAQSNVQVRYHCATSRDQILNSVALFAPSLQVGGGIALKEGIFKIIADK